LGSLALHLVTQRKIYEQYRYFRNERSNNPWKILFDTTAE